MRSFAAIIYLIFIITLLGTETKGGTEMAFSVTSPAFEEGKMIEMEYTCEGADASPEIEWHGAPEGTRSFALIVDDPDAPVGTFVHWVVYDIPASINTLTKGVVKISELPNGTKQGTNGFGRVGYGGPCPPIGHGTHRYFFKLYALDTESLGLPSSSSKSQVFDAMSGHLLAETTMMGTYKRR